MMKNDFSARERKFISTLGGDLHLNVRWDEFAVLPEGKDGDGEEVNVVTLRFPGDDGDEEEQEEEVDNKEGGGVKDTNGEVPITTLNGNDDEWVDDDEDEDDEDEDEESRAAVDRVLKKYDKAKVFDDDGGFDERHESKVEEKMAEWKGAYYKVCVFFFFNLSWKTMS
jgi:5'-3' exoribonuclease 1